MNNFGSSGADNGDDAQQQQQGGAVLGRLVNNLMAYFCGNPPEEMSNSQAQILLSHKVRFCSTFTLTDVLKQVREDCEGHE